VCIVGFIHFACQFEQRGNGFDRTEIVVHGGVGGGGGSGIANDKKKLTVNQRELKKFLLEKINQPDNILEIEKVNRYMQFVELIAKLKQDIKKQGVTIVVENGSQSYIKTHPAIAEISKLNTSMLAIERTWNFKVDYIEDINDDDLI